jgi:putative hydrolase of the HAD superfamily
MIPIFDLDDTLFQERSYVESGFLAVAIDLYQGFGWPVGVTLKRLLSTLDNEGRGAVFNRLLEAHGIYSLNHVKRCIKVYRNHHPNIQLMPEADCLLNSLEVRPYLVTDGNKVVQKNKIKALGIESKFNRIYITHQYGIRHSKPSIYCFELIRKRERCEWSDMFYVGDNPEKDFVNLNTLGVHTIRVTTGEHAEVVAKSGYEANYTINSLNEISEVLTAIDRKNNNNFINMD